MQIDNILTKKMSDQPALPKTNAEAAKVAKEFEALFANYMLRSMRNSVMKSDLIPESTGEQIYSGMLDEEYANMMAEQGSLGLAKLVLKEMDNSSSKTSVMDALRNLGKQPSWMTDQRFIPVHTAADAQSLGSRVSPWRDIIADASKKYGIDSNLISAVVAQESGGNPEAISRMGAKGLMQLIDTTASDMGVKNVFDPSDNINGGAQYLGNLLALHKGNERLALASYNAGPAAVERYNGIPPYPETQNYVENVLKLREYFAQQQTKEQTQ